MNLLMITFSYPPSLGGMQNYAFEIAKGLYESGVNIKVLTPHFEDDKEFDEKQAFEIIRKGSFERFLTVFLPSFFSSLQLIPKMKIEKLLAETWLSGLICYLLAKIYVIDYYVGTHGSELFDGMSHPLKKFLMLKTFKNARKVFAVSNYTKQILTKNGIPEEKVAVIFNGVDPGKFNHEIDCLRVLEKHKAKNKKIILTVGRLVERKGHDLVIKALPLVLEKIPESVYVIVGDGPEKNRLEKLVKELNLKGKVIFAGSVPVNDRQNTLLAYYHACDVFVMPNRIVRGDVEGFGIVFLEAGACGKPVIGGRSSGVPDAIIDGETGLLVNPESEEEIAMALIRLLLDKKLAGRLGRNGRKRVEKELNWKKLSRKYYDVICSA